MNPKNNCDVDAMMGWRTPTEREASGIQSWFSAYYFSKIKTCRRLSSILSVVGFVFLCVIPQHTIAGIVLGLVAYGLVFKLIYDKKIMQERISLFEQRKYRVMDGTVESVQANPDTPGVCNVRFVSVNGQGFSHWRKVRQENVEVGSPLLLLTVEPGTTKGQIVWAFTPFMLTEEGSKLPW